MQNFSDNAFLAVVLNSLFRITQFSQDLSRVFPKSHRVRPERAGCFRKFNRNTEGFERRTVFLPLFDDHIPLNKKRGMQDLVQLLNH